MPVVLNALGVPQGSSARLLGLLRWPLLLAGILFGLTCLYRFGPSRAHAQWRWVTWGSAFAAVAWLAASLLYSWYVANFGTYNATYGSLGAIIGFIIFMIFKDCSAVISRKPSACTMRRAEKSMNPASRPHATKIRSGR